MSVFKIWTQKEEPLAFGAPIEATTEIEGRSLIDTIVEGHKDGEENQQDPLLVETEVEGSVGGFDDDKENEQDPLNIETECEGG